MILFEPSPAIKSRIRERLIDMPPHMRAVWNVVLQGCTYIIVEQGSGAFAVPKTRPALLQTGDDLAVSKGPAAFHRRSLEAYLPRCMGVAIVSSEATVESYSPVALQTIGLRHDTALIETQPAHADEWLDLVERRAPLANVLVSKPYPRERAH